MGARASIARRLWSLGQLNIYLHYDFADKIIALALKWSVQTANIKFIAHLVPRLSCQH